MTPEEQTYHDNWQKEFLKQKRTVLFGAIGHNPKTFKQYTPDNVTGLIQRFKQRKRILGLSSTYRTALAVIVSLSSVPLAYCFNPTTYKSTLGLLAPDMLPVVITYLDALGASSGLFTFTGGVCTSIAALVSLFFCYLPAVAAYDCKNPDKLKPSELNNKRNLLVVFSVLCIPPGIMSAYTIAMYLYVLALCAFGIVFASVLSAVSAILSYLFWPIVAIICLALLCSA